MSTHFLDDLGGNKELAEALGVSSNAVSNWRSPERDIPWRHRHVIARMAAERGVELPKGFWGEAA